MQQALRYLDYPPVWLFAALGCVWAEARLLPGLIAIPAVQTLGQGLFWLGLAVLAGAALSFLRARTTIVPHQMPQKLITGGLYRISRNPIYLGDLLILVGLSLKWGALSGLLLAPAFVAILTARFIQPEEARLRAAFGAEAETFFARTRRWV
ncbi:MAG: methyltransferase family protein [Roseinatronobacter sp.]